MKKDRLGRTAFGKLGVHNTNIPGDCAVPQPESMSSIIKDLVYSEIQRYAICLDLISS